MMPEGPGFGSGLKWSVETVRWSVDRLQDQVANMGQCIDKLVLNIS